MFRLEFFCEDKQLPKVLHALSGMISGQPTVQPVANAMLDKSGKVVAKTDGDPVSIMRQHFKENGVTTVTSALAREMTQLCGMVPSSYQYLLKQAVKGGLLKKTGKGVGTRYHVVEEH